MIRLLTALGVFLALTLWFLGEDRGQYVHPPRTDEAAAAAPVARQVFVAAPKVAGLPVGADPVAPEPEASAQSAVGVAMGLPEPVAPQQVIRLMRAPAGATVRSGPGATYPATGTLRAGFVVMVVDDTSAPGWVRVRTDGGAAAWVAAGLLRE
jgi:hypothetical protein